MMSTADSSPHAIEEVENQQFLHDFDDDSSNSETDDEDGSMQLDHSDMTLVSEASNQYGGCTQGPNLFFHGTLFDLRHICTIIRR